MKILFRPPKSDSPTFEVDHQIQNAIAALHGYLIRIRGAGRFADGTAAIILAREGDADYCRCCSQARRHPRYGVLNPREFLFAELRPRSPGLGGANHPLPYLY